MAKQRNKKQDIINGRISLMFFGLLLFAGLLRLILGARYRYDLIFRPMLKWLLPTCFGIFAALFVVLLILWLKKGRPKTEKLVDLPFLILLTIPLMAAFLFPWLTLFFNALQFFKLSVTLVFIGTLGGFIGYIGYGVLGTVAVLPAAGCTVNVLALVYLYACHLSPKTFFFNTAEYWYLDGWSLALILSAAVALLHLITLIFFRKTITTLPAWSFFVPAALTVVLLMILGIANLAMTPVQIIFFCGIGLIALWYPVWCTLKRYKKL